MANRIMEQEANAFEEFKKYAKDVWGIDLPKEEDNV